MPRNNKDSIHKRFFALLPYLWPALAVAAGLYLLLAPSQPTMVGSSTAQAESDRNEIELVSLSRTVVPHATRNIEDIRVGDRVLAANPEITEEERANWGEPDWTDWQHIELEMTQADGGVLHVSMIRPREWFSLNRVEEGAEIFLDLPEMGVWGSAKVVSISACPQIRSGSGQVVTATFAHPPSTTVLDVTFEDDLSASALQPPVSRLGVTDNHLFWSTDREDFIAIGEMSIGERVLTYSGETKRIAQKLPRPCPQLVYNLEVYGEHVYFVGELGLLVHNQYGNDLDGLDDLAPGGQGYRTRVVDGRTYELRPSNGGGGPSRWHRVGDASSAGRTGKQARLRELATDDRQPSWVRGWIRNEQRHIETGDRKTIRLPGNARSSASGGKVLAHKRGMRAADGNNYADSVLQDTDLHMLEHKYEGY